MYSALKLYVISAILIVRISIIIITPGPTTDSFKLIEVHPTPEETGKIKCVDKRQKHSYILPHVVSISMISWKQRERESLSEEEYRLFRARGSFTPFILYIVISVLLHLIRHNLFPKLVECDIQFTAWITSSFVARLIMLRASLIKSPRVRGKVQEHCEEE